MSDVSRALEVLLMSLELDHGIVSHTEEFPTSEADVDYPTRRVFASPTGVSVIAESLNQMAHARLKLISS